VEQEVALIRIEELTPFPAEELEQEMFKYRHVMQFVWCQEEPQNMGAWSFARSRLYDRFGDSHRIRRVTRHESGSPATGSHAIHNQEQKQLLDEALTT
jgi:2-oxoglutarate dehydrogenase E1 component